MPRLIDQYGNPIDAAALKEPQTSRIAALQNQFLTPMLSGLTPATLAGYLRAADDGDLLSQHRLFADMEERDTHLLAEMTKRKLAVMSLDWDIVPPRNATAAEKKAAEWLKEVLTDAADPFEDLLLALMDGVGHGFAAVEMEWRREGAEWLPAFHPRPQEWFRLSADRRALHLADASADGAPLQPFGWALHSHGKAKTGYLGRMGLYRALVWPFLYKAYALGDFAEFLETYGLPIVVGKYYQGASADEKASLMRAVTALGHDARAIMPADMTLEIEKVTADGSGTPHLSMIGWADASISKGILGQTLSADTGKDGGGSYALGKVHNEVRHDIRDADARQIAGTVTRDLLYPLLALNRGADGLARCPRLVFDTGEAEDLTAYAEALPKLVQAGMKTIPVSWVHEKLRIPEPEDGEAVLGPEPATPPTPQAPPRGGGASGEPPANPLANPGKTPGSPVPAAAMAALAAAAEPQPWSARAADQLAAPADAEIGRWLDTIRAMLDSSDSLEEFRSRLLAAWPDLDTEGLTGVMSAALAAADLKGRLDVRRENPAPGPAPVINLSATIQIPDSAIASMAAAQPAPPATVVENHVHVQPAPVEVNNQVQPAPVTVNNEVVVQPAAVSTVVVPTHPSRAVQTVERDPESLEVTRTVTTYEKE